jgi:hypothetical protein
MDGQMPFEEWIYGKPPNEVDFVRINGNRVIRVEVAKVGESPVIFTKDEVEGLMRTDGKPLEADRTQRIAKVGDVEHDPDKEAAAPPPSLRNPGETLPSDDPKNRVGDMRPVQFPKPKQDPQPGENPDGVPDTSQPATSAQPSPTNTSPSPATPPSETKPQMWLPAAGDSLR